MALIEVFATVRRSIVAFASRVAVAKKGSEPLFPTVLGTGFVVDERGLVATNRHVAEALLALPKHPVTGRSVAMALVYSEISADQSMAAACVPIREVRILETFDTSCPFFGEPVPDLAFAQLDVRGIPAMALANHGAWSVGRAIATAGFPLGERAMVIYERVNQVAPILRAGIIASVFPFPVAQPHGFTIDVMTLGGESGSPIFAADEPVAIGLLHAGFDGTNITLGVPSWLVAAALADCLKQITFTNGPTLEDYLSGEAGPGWESL